MKYRPHKGSLADSMAEVVELDGTLDALVAHLIATAPDWWPRERLPRKDNVEVQPYSYDDRIGWLTYVVVVEGMPWGFTDGPAK